jgi:peptide-methionine (S)-S-oxide reductase
MQIRSSQLSRSIPRLARKGRGFFLMVLGVALIPGFAGVAVSETAMPADPPPARASASTAAATQRVVLAGGCFWGVQAVFQHTKGVINAVSGYAGGTLPNPSYEQVSSGRTGHAESVEVTFDPKEIPFRRLLQIYFLVAHDPTELNRQGPDEGTQYRSEIFTTSDAQRLAAKDYIFELEKANVFSRPVVTKVEPLEAFYQAEGYHQDYAMLHPESLYIKVYDLPKIGDLKKRYPELYREEPVHAGANGE